MQRGTPRNARMHVEDTELIRKAHAGDMQAFEDLVFRHDKRVLAIVAGFVTSAEDAKDLYQEIFIRVFRGLRSFQFRSEFSTWVHRIATNVCLSHRAREKKTGHLFHSVGYGDEGDDAGTEAESSDDPPDRQAMTSEIALRVEVALASLSPKQRMVFSLKHYQGHTLKEIASMMGCMEGTVKRYLFTATRRMREQLKDMV